MTTRLTATSLLSRSLLRRVTSGTRYPLSHEPSARIPQSPSRTASSTSSGDPTGQEPPAPAMDSPIKVVSHIGGGRGAGGGGAIDAGRSARKPLSLWPGMYHSPVTNALWEARSSIFERMMDAGNAGGDQNQRPQTELLTKTPAQSRTSIVYKFASDDILREQYRDPWNEVRIGKLLEDLDALAGTIAVKHCSDEDSTTRPLLVVTASVDKMVLKKPIRVDADLNIAGAVTYVGRSSIDIQIEVTQVDQDGDAQSDPTALTANFTFVARDSITGKSAPVNRLSPETEKEKQLFGEREARDKLRKRKREELKGGLENGGIHKVDVGDFLRFKSCVLYTQLDNPQQPLVNVEVVAHVTRPELRKSEVSNTFHFTFTVSNDALKNGLKIRNVVPSTEEEARRILERMDADGLFD
ncbi:hypothetical protein PR202_ga16343 [Eleusine coracana subsp. coracana]|uniref:HotDog ACOT-type domain-containing protein n=1 Tax=Eleusine coracana subsp. coracana TaxID=191504 RepID=A0AAV5CMK1_ELECO|nr:hypothetical protein PR202_ga16343 [Eleusine coracana subsp. coracana]